MYLPAQTTSKETHAFARHRVHHLSPSSLNLWMEHPGLWSLKYLAGIKEDGNAAMWRGSAVENGLAAMLRGADVNPFSVAHQAFDLNCQGEISDEITEQRDMILPMLSILRENWTPPSDLNATQLRVEHYIDGIPIPVIGYLDFAFDGIDIDLKTTTQCPSKPYASHIRQVSLYRAARGRNGGLLYVTPKKHAYYEVTDDMMERAMSDLTSAARSLYSFLGRVGSAREAIECLPMNTTHHQWSEKHSAKLKEFTHDILIAG